MRERRKAEDLPKDDSFAVLFTALNLILLSFFILLNSIAIQDQERVKKALGSIRGTFGILLGGENASRAGKSLVRSDQITIGDDDRAPDSNELVNRTRDLLNRMGMASGSDAVLVQTADGVSLRLSDPIAFGNGRTELDPRLFPLLDGVANVIKQAKVRVEIRGYTDALKPARYPSNVELSAVRAISVARYLIEAAGLDPKLVTAQGRGFDPKQGDRAVELVIRDEAIASSLDSGMTL